MPQYLYGRDSKNKVRVLTISMFKVEDHYEIRRKSGLLNGKLTDGPVKTVKVGKQKRTVLEQVELEIRSIVNKKRDEGYKLLGELFPDDSDVPDPLDHERISQRLPLGKTYADGLKKLMLAKDPKGVKKYYNADETPNPLGWNREWWVSRKLDGVRAGVGKLADGYKSISRKGKTFDPAFTKIFQSKKLAMLFKKIGEHNMIDGELYIHGRSLQSLSGVARLDEYTPERHDELEFWIFDYTDETKTAEERALLLNSLADEFDLATDKIKINTQVKLGSYDSIKKIHDIWVADGYEGAICRDASSLYGFGTRDDRMIKVKEFQDDEFEIIGHKLGLRGAEDMCFICRTPDGKTFESKPIGSRDVKLAYVADIENIIGKMLTVKFFNYTEDGIPFINTGKCIRDYE